MATTCTSASPIERFNKYVLKLVDIVDSSTDLDKSYIQLINDFYKTNLITFPTIILDNVGPILKKNSELIQTQNDKIFDNIIKEINMTCKNKDESFQQELKMIIQTLQNKWTEYSIEEKNIIFKILKILLNEYIKFNDF
jgi:hypothetical protein